MHLRTFLFSKWMGLNRKTFHNKFGEYHKVATDAAIFIPILDACCYNSIVFINELTYVYQNAGNTIHAKKEIGALQKSETLASIFKAQHSVDQDKIKKYLLRNTNPISIDAEILDSFNKSPSHGGLKKTQPNSFEKQKNKSGVITIVTPNYLADAIVCLMSYQNNIRNLSQLYVFISTKDKDEISACQKILNSMGITAIFPTTLKITKQQSQELIKKYSLYTDEYRWAMKAVVLLELLGIGNDLALFLDPDTYTVSDITDIHKELMCHPISVFPHFRDPDHEYLRGVLYKDGFFNGGMLGATQDGIPHLTDLYKRCLTELKKEPGRHRWDDQKYFDLFTLEVKNLYVNFDRGINYNPWNYEPVEGLVAPTQRSILLKSGYFVRHWHMSTMLIKNSIELSEKKFSVYRPVVAIYLLTLMYTIVLVAIKAKSIGLFNKNSSMGLDDRIKNLSSRLNQLSNLIPTNDLLALFESIIGTQNFALNDYVEKWAKQLLSSICFDNFFCSSKFLLNFSHPSNFGFLTDKVISNPNINSDDERIECMLQEMGYSVKKRLQQLQSCKITY